MTPQQIREWPVTGYRQSPFFDGKGFNTDGLHGYQCKDEVNAFFHDVSGVIPPGDAIDVAGKRIKGFQWIPYTHGFKARAGDVTVFGPPYAVVDGESLGHTGVVIDGAVSVFRSLDQNWYNANLIVGSPPRIVTHDYKGLLGVQRPVVLINNSVGDEMYAGKTAEQWAEESKKGRMVDENYARAFFGDYYGEDNPTRAQLDSLIGRPWMEVVNDARQSEQFKLRKQVNEDRQTELKEAQKRIVELSAQIKDQEWNERVVLALEKIANK